MQGQNAALRRQRHRLPFLWRGLRPWFRLTAWPPTPGTAWRKRLCRAIRPWGSETLAR